jgi:hypothetical protein
MALLGRAARSPHALAGRSMLGAAELPEAVIRPSVCAADLVCLPAAGANPSNGLCTSLDTYASIAADATMTMTLCHPDAARADLQLNAWFFSLGGVTASRVNDAAFPSDTARRGFSFGDNPLPCGAGLGRAE